MRVLMTGGGTGGHVNPALAIANTIKQNDSTAEIAYVGTKHGIESKLVPAAGYPMYFVEIRGIRRSLSLANLKTAYLTLTSPIKAKKIIREFKPDLVVGTGGYVSWPVLSAAAKAKMDEGFTAIKMNATEELQMIDTYDKIDAVLERVAAIREACGKYFGIAIDFHGRVHKPMAKVLAKKLEEFDPMFIEEPVLCENMEVFGEIAAACNIPIATGERLFTKYDFKRLLEVGGVDIIQPDLSHAGGVTEVKKIAAKHVGHLGRHLIFVVQVSIIHQIAQFVQIDP